MIKLDYKKTASFDVDAQNGFTPICPNELPVPDGENIVVELNAMATVAKYRIGSKDWHHPNALHIATEKEPQFSAVNTKNIDIRWNRHCIAGEYGAELLNGLPHWTEYDYFVWKGMEADVHVYGACYHTLDNTRSTGVIEWLKANGVENVVVGGLALDFCVATTAMQLADAGFNVIVNTGASRAINAPVDTTTTLGNAIRDMKSKGINFINDHREITVFNRSL